MVNTFGRSPSPPTYRTGLGALGAGLLLLTCSPTPPSQPGLSAATPAQPEAALQAPPAPPISGIRAVHHNGQTFVTWSEARANASPLLLYRAGFPITTLEGLTPLAEVPPDSAAWPRMAAISDAPYRRHVIDALGQPLAAGAGLYVHTPHPQQPQQAWYALGLPGVTRGAPLASLDAPVLEREGNPVPLLIHQGPGGRQRLYVLWEDDQRFPHTQDGYAYAFWLGLPPTLEKDGAPLTLHLHAWGESWSRFYRSSRKDSPGSPYDLPTVWLELDDPGNTWWSGFGSPAHRNGARKKADLYTFQRLERVLDWVLQGGAGIPMDPDRVVIYGGSMGGTGALATALRRPERFAGVYALSPLVRPETSTWGRAGFEHLFGPVLTPFPTPDGKSLYQHMDLIRMLEQHATLSSTAASSTAASSTAASSTALTELPLTVTVHGRADTIVEWQTQGRPWLEARDRLILPGPGVFVEGDHSQIFDSFAKALIPAWRPTEYGLSRRQSFPVFSSSPGDDALDQALPACRGEDPLYRLGFRGGSVTWSTPATPVLGLKQPEDDPGHYRIGLKLRSDLCGIPDQGTTTVRLNRRQRFRPHAGELLRWEMKQKSGARTGGSVILPPTGVLLLSEVPVTQEGGILTVTRGP